MPDNNRELLELLNAPDTVDFVVRKTNYFDEFINNVEGVTALQTLADQYVICYASKDVFERMVSVLGTNFISALSLVLGPLNLLDLQSAGILQVHSQPYLDLKGRGVLIGFVDTGIDYTLDVFKYSDGTSKIRYIYDMTAPDDNPPEGFFLGREYSNEQINEALRSPNPYEIVPHWDTSGHGTFLASVAAGAQSASFSGAAPESEIIAVKLRKARQYYLDLYAVPKEQENAFSSTAVMLGVEYIIKKARELERPVAICIGLGTNFGGHDGMSIFEEYLSVVANMIGVCLCTAAGNESQARHHTQGIIPEAEATNNIDINVGENAGDIFISIWSGISDRISVSIRSPSGELVNRIPARSGYTTTSELVLEQSAVNVAYFFPIERSGGQFTGIKIFNATPGIWTITLHGDIILDGTYHAWLPMTGFVSPNVEFLAATPYYTITVPGTMLGSICCGAYNSIQNSLYSRSSWGPTLLPMNAPDLVAPGENIGGFFPSGYGFMSGTSVATAITTGAAALLLQWGIIDQNDLAISTYQIRSYLIRGCYRSEDVRYPNTQWGYGSLNLLQSFQLMREL